MQNQHHIPNDKRLSLPVLSTSFLLFLLLLCQATSDNLATALQTTALGTTTWKKSPSRVGVPRYQRSSSSRLFLTQGNSSDAEEEMSFGDSAVVIPDLDWRVQKLRLEEENKKRFLKAKPRFLPYKDAMMWVQAWGRRWETQEDWWVIWLLHKKAMTMADFW